MEQTQQEEASGDIPPPGLANITIRKTHKKVLALPLTQELFSLESVPDYNVKTFQAKQHVHTPRATNVGHSSHEINLNMSDLKENVETIIEDDNTSLPSNTGEGEFGSKSYKGSKEDLKKYVPRPRTESPELGAMGMGLGLTDWPRPWRDPWGPRKEIKPRGFSEDRDLDPWTLRSAQVPQEVHVDMVNKLKEELQAEKNARNIEEKSKYYYLQERNDLKHHINGLNEYYQGLIDQNADYQLKIKEFEKQQEQQKSAYNRLFAQAQENKDQKDNAIIQIKALNLEVEQLKERISKLSISRESTPEVEPSSTLSKHSSPHKKGGDKKPKSTRSEEDGETLTPQDMRSLRMYDGREDAVFDFLNQVKAFMKIRHNLSDDNKKTIFVAKLQGSALDWYESLKDADSLTFEETLDRFKTRFIQVNTRQSIITQMRSERYCWGMPIPGYVDKFRRYQRLMKYDDSTILMELKMSFLPNYPSIKMHMEVKNPRNLDELQEYLLEFYTTYKHVASQDPNNVNQVNFQQLNPQILYQQPSKGSNKQRSKNTQKMTGSSTKMQYLTGSSAKTQSNIVFRQDGLIELSIPGMIPVIINKGQCGLCMEQGHISSQCEKDLKCDLCSARHLTRNCIQNLQKSGNKRTKESSQLSAEGTHMMGEM